jgi:hypothetical protein
MSEIFQTEYCSCQLQNSHTPTAPRGKRSDITDKDRDLFVSSFKELLDMLDNKDKETETETETETEQYSANKKGITMINTVTNA